MQSNPTMSGRRSSRTVGALLLVALATVLVVLGATPAGAEAPSSRTQGFPTSTNGASSMHLYWNDEPSGLTEASAVLEVVEAPKVAKLYFWALQVDFVDRAGVKVGGAHLGLQWDPSRPGSTGVNFGGYAGTTTTAGLLEGTASTLPSANGDPNTRDYPWEAGHRYQLRIAADTPGWWTGTVTDLTTNTTVVVRKLRADGRIARPLVFSEVFARCDAPTTAVRWSELKPAPKGVRVTYQSYRSGGCTNTNADTSSKGVVQRTNTKRSVVDYEVLRVRW